MVDECEDYLLFDDVDPNLEAIQMPNVIQSTGKFLELIVFVD